MAAPSLLRTATVVVGFMCAVAAIAVFFLDHARGSRLIHHSSPTTGSAANPRSAGVPDSAARAEFSLPGDGVEAARVLGRPRPDVRRLLGTPELSTDDTDVFHAEVVLQVHYLGDRANSLIVGAPQAARHERYVRRWLHLPGDGPLVMNGTPLQLALFVGDDDRLGVELPQMDAVPLPAMAPIAKAATTTGKLTAEGLLRAFPKLPDNVLSRCKEQGRPGARGLDCRGFEGTVSYEVDDHNLPQTLTLLDPSGATTQDKCRNILLASLSGLVATQKAEEPPVTRKEYFASDTVQAMVLWAPEHGFRKTPTCSVVACLKGSGRSSCAPR